MIINYHEFAYFLFQGVSLYFFLYSFYWLVTIIIASFYKQPKLENKKELKDKWLIILPAYSPNKTFFDVLCKIRDTLPHKNLIEIKVYILFQNTSSHFIDQCYDKMNFICNHKSFGRMEGNSYINALKFISHQIKSDNKLKAYNASHIILLDKDNIVSNHFFEGLYSLRQQNYELIQGRRLPIDNKNGISSYDQISEALNDMMMRKYRVMMGWKPELSGSAFLVQKELFLLGIDKLDINNPGMDKNLLINWLLHTDNTFKSCYSSSTLVYEEKTNDIVVLQSQRTRWFAEQYQTLFSYLIPLLYKGIKSFNLEIFDYTIALARPPRSIHILIIPILCILDFFILKEWNINTISFTMLNIGIIIFLSKEKLWNESIQVFKIFPRIILSNLRSIFKIGKNTKGNFIHTERNND